MYCPPYYSIINSVCVQSRLVLGENCTPFHVGFSVKFEPIKILQDIKNLGIPYVSSHFGFVIINTKTVNFVKNNPMTIHLVLVQLDNIIFYFLMSKYVHTTHVEY